jgi:hypothetical protein
MVDAAATSSATSGTPLAAAASTPLSASPTAPAAVPQAAQSSQTPPAANSAVGVLDPPAAEEPQVKEERTEAPAVEEAVKTEEVPGDPAEKKEEIPARKKPNFVLIGGFAAVGAVAVLFLLTARAKQSSNTPLPGDLGPGIMAASGLRGHLDTRWEGDAKSGRVAYQLRIEPMEDRWQAGFSRVTLNPPMPMALNIRLLDSAGFALCGKEIDFRFDPQTAGIPITVVMPAAADMKRISLAQRNAAIEAARETAINQARAEEAAREQGKDIFQNQTTPDGLVSAANVQGTLPCSPDQYRRVDYWDFNTNFPTLEEQAALVDPKAALAAARLDSAHPRGRTLPRTPQQGFVMQGDDRVTAYDSAQGVLSAESRSFRVDRRYGQATASAWANDYSLIHYRCDQQANCALTAAGQAAVLHARLNE